MSKVLICEVCQKFSKVRSEKEFQQKVKEHQTKMHPKLKLREFETKPQLNLF